MVFLTLFSSIVLALLCSSTYSTQYLKQVDTQTSAMFTSASSIMQEKINNLYRQVSFIASQSVIKDIYIDEYENETKSSFTQNYNSLNLVFTNFLKNTTWAENIALISPKGNIYTIYQNGFNYQIEQFSSELSQTSISWLPARDNIFYLGSDPVVPVCFPLQVRSNVSFCSGQSADLIIVVYLNSKAITNMLNQFNTIANSTLYLLNYQNEPLISECGFSFSSVQKEMSQSVTNFSFDVKTKNQKYRVSVQPLREKQLQFLHVLSYQTVNETIFDIYKTSLCAGLLISFVSVLFSFKISSTITIPIKRLLNQITEIQNRNYNISPVTKYHDEIHLMDTALCNLAHIVSQQIDEIHERETMHNQLQLQAVTDQINPHFLYNTLDFIYWEVLNEHSKNAAEMISSLGKFLRLTLNHGHEMLELQGVMQHTKEYINIINMRFDYHINFIYTISPEMENFLLPKSIFQPLAENSILHGFQAKNGVLNVVNPCVTISCFQENDAAVICVADNGAGFDPDQMNHLIYSSDNDTNHTGFKNVVKRLAFVFKDSLSISVSSIPYYQNEIRFEIKIPNSDRTILQ